MAILDIDRLKEVEKFINDIPLNVDAGKIAHRCYKTHDFWHPVLDAQNEALRTSARIRMDQIRAPNIGEKAKALREANENSIALSWR